MIRHSLALTFALSGCFQAKDPPQADEVGEDTTGEATNGEATNGEATASEATAAEATNGESDAPGTSDTTTAMEEESGGCIGAQGCACTPGGGCDPGLVCSDGVCTSTLCGDGVVERLEACDDGNTVNSDGCESDCTATVIAEVVAGIEFTCVRLGAGDVRCWGRNQEGQLGNGLGPAAIGDDEPASDSVVVELGAPAKQIAAGDAHACALLETGTATCWGLAADGRLGNGDTMQNVGDDETPLSAGVVTLGMEIVEIAAGGAHTCAIQIDGKVSCWGRNDLGQLGLNNPGAYVSDPENAGKIEFVAVEPVVQLSLGNSYSCARFGDGTVRCWGQGDYGQLGNGSTASIGSQDVPVIGELSAIDLQGASAVDLDAGHVHTCVVLDTQGVACWGYNNEGQLGDGNSPNSNSLPKFPSLGVGVEAEQVTAGHHSCVVTTAHEVSCWGYNFHGSVGDGVGNGNPPYPTPSPPLQLGGAVQAIAAGLHHTCAIMATGELRCWGYDASGQLGLGHTNPIGDNELPFSAGVVPLFP
jgi:cysteine-rich repeat protein